MRECLEKMTALAQSHLAVAQTQQYDHLAQERRTDPGQKVFVRLAS